VGGVAISFTLRQLLFKLHLYVALAVSIYVVILGVTGALLAFDTVIDHLVHAKLAYVRPAPPRLSFAALGDAVAKVYPNQRIIGYEMGEAPNLSTLVVLSSTSGRNNTGLYVNPYTGQILGSRTNGPNILGIIAQLHTQLAPRRPGHGRLAPAFVNWITVATLFVLLSGIWLWWPSMHFGIGAGGGRPFWCDLHLTTGIVAAVFLVLLTGSGIVMAFGRTILHTAPMGRRLWNLNQAIHFGVIFGVSSRVIMALASLLIVLQVVSGAVMWIKRVPFRRMIPALVATAAVMVVAVYTILAPTGI
jgi:uncharacterized iron-regulated membrane protein